MTARPFQVAHVATPLVALVTLAVALAFPPGPAFGSVLALVLIAAVGSAVHHAETVAHRVGEPYGTLVLALAVTVIEVAMIVSLMSAAEGGKPALARDAIFATIMIIANGVVGVCLLVGGVRHRVQAFQVDGAAPALAVLAALSTLSLVLPTFTTTTSGPTYSPAQLKFAAAASLALWLVFVFFQTVRHRDYFLPRGGDAAPEAHATPPSVARAWSSFALLIAALIAVVGLAKALSPMAESALAAAGAPPAVLGILVAMVVLLPETVAAVRAAHADRLQPAMNLALGSALATIGLTIPAVAVLALAWDMPLWLGLGAKEIVLLTLTFLVAGFTLGSGRTTLMQGAVHLVLFLAFLFLAVVP